MYDIDPNFRRKTSLNNGIEIKSGYDAVVLAIEDVLETISGEISDEPTKGTNLTTDYLVENVNNLDSLIIKDIVSDALIDNLPEINFKESDIRILPNFKTNEYEISINITEGKEQEELKNLTFSLKVAR